MSRLLQINTNIGWNSVGRITGRIGEAAIAAGWESHIAYGRDPGDASRDCTSRLIRVGGQAGCYGHALLTRLADAHGRGSAAATRSLIRRIDRLAPDVVHLHNIHGYYLNYRILFDYLAATQVPVVWTLHDCWPLTGHCPFPDQAGCDRWQTGCHDCRLRRDYPASWLVDRSAANFRDKAAVFGGKANLTLVPVSHWLDSIVGRSYLRDRRRVVIHNGIDTGLFAPGDGPRERSVTAAASVWDARKGLDDLVRLRSLLPADVSMRVVGLTPGQCRSLPSGIEGLPRCADAACLAAIYRRAGVLVNPSSADNLPSVNLEAQACGTPVVCYDTGGMPETVTPQTGIVVPRGDVGAMARAAMRILDNPGSFAADDCRRNITGRFDASAAFDKYIDLYNQLSK